MSPSAHPIYARIAGTGSYLPQQVVTNDDLVKRGVDGIKEDSPVASLKGLRVEQSAPRAQPLQSGPRL